MGKGPGPGRKKVDMKNNNKKGQSGEGLAGPRSMVIKLEGG